MNTKEVKNCKQFVTHIDVNLTMSLVYIKYLFVVFLSLVRLVNILPSTLTYSFYDRVAVILFLVQFYSNLYH